MLLKQINNRVFFIAAYIFISINLYSQVSKENLIKLPIKEAIDKNMLDLNISGAGDPRVYLEIIDRDGVHFGKCMRIVLKSKIDSLILLKIDCGTELIPLDSSFQTMIVTKTIELPLYPNETYATKFYAMCGQIHDHPPHIAMPYVVGDLSDSNTVKLARYFEENFIQNMLGQHALWAHTDNASKEELIKYGADSITLAKTINILNEAGIITTLNPTENILEEKNIDETEETYVMVDTKYIYGAASLISVLILTIIILLVRIKKLSA